MSGTTNKVILIGNLGKAPEIRQLQSGKFVANFSIATDDSYIKDGEKQQVTDWHNIQVYTPGIIPVIKQYLKKGSKVYIEGALKHSKYKDQYGNDKYTTFIKVADNSHKFSILSSNNANQELNNIQNPTNDYQRMKEEGY